MSDMPPGALAQPGPVAFQVKAMAIPDGSKIILLRIEHTTGTTMVSMDSELAKTLGKALTENATGLHLVQPGDMPRPT